MPTATRNPCLVLLAATLLILALGRHKRARGAAGEWRDGSREGGELSG